MTIDKNYCSFEKAAKLYELGVRKEYQRFQGVYLIREGDGFEFGVILWVMASPEPCMSVTFVDGHLTNFPAHMFRPAYGLVEMGMVAEWIIEHTDYDKDIGDHLDAYTDTSVESEQYISQLIGDLLATLIIEAVEKKYVAPQQVSLLLNSTPKKQTRDEQPTA